METLQINNRKEFNNNVWTDPEAFKDSLQYNEWINKTCIPALKRIYDYMEAVSYDDARDEEPARPSDADLYVLGDVINIFDNITVDAERSAETWTVTAGDFDAYDTDHLTEEQMNDLIDRAASIAQNDGMADYFWEAIKVAAEEVGLEKRNDN